MGSKLIRFNMVNIMVADALATHDTDYVEYVGSCLA